MSVMSVALVSRVQLRTVTVLVIAQLAGGLGLAAAVSVGGLIAADLVGAVASGVAIAAAVGGAALMTLVLGRLMHRSGRRVGLRTGWQIGTVGALVAVAAAIHGSMAALVVAMVLFGAGEAASGAARYAAADLAGRQGAAMGIVLASTAVATTVGPLLIGPAGTLAARYDLPVLTGPFVMAAVAFSVAGMVVAVGLRPDPLLLSRRERPAVHEDALERRGGIRLLLTRHGRRGLVSLAVANVVMVGLMAIVPLHASGHHHHAELSGIGLLFSLHLAAMYAPSPLTGWLADRSSARLLSGVGAFLLLSVGLDVWLRQPEGSELAVVLVVLGVGWNLAYVGGSLLVSQGVDPSVLPRVQAAADATMGAAAAVGSVGAGLLFAVGGFGAVGLVGVVLAVVLGVTMLQGLHAARRTGHDASDVVLTARQDLGTARAERGAGRAPGRGRGRLRPPWFGSAAGRRSRDRQVQSPR